MQLSLSANLNTFGTWAVRRLAYLTCPAIVILSAYCSHGRVCAISIAKTDCADEKYACTRRPVFSWVESAVTLLVVSEDKDDMNWLPSLSCSLQPTSVTFSQCKYRFEAYSLATAGTRSNPITWNLKFYKRFIASSAARMIYQKWPITDDRAYHVF